MFAGDELVAWTANIAHWNDVGGLGQDLAARDEHETAAAWSPGAGGLCAHAIVHDRTNAQRMWCGISAVGVFRTDDGGRTWQPKNKGVTVVLEDKIYEIEDELRLAQ